MKKKYILIHALLFIVVIPCFAQQKKMQFQSVNSFELISGQSPLSTGFQSINGFRFSSWFTGVGAGVDNYNYKTLPLFFEATKFFGLEKRAFLYGDAGYDFPLKDKPGKEISYYSSYHFTGGLYADWGMGYQFHLYKKTSLLFRVGYSYKELESKTGLISDYYCPYLACPVDFRKYQFNYGRIILKSGLIF